MSGGPSFDVLDRNLAALFTRAYVPVLPRAAFRAELLELARDEARAHAHGAHGTSKSLTLRRFVSVALPLAAAAALLAWFAASRLGGGEGEPDGRGGPGNAPQIAETGAPKTGEGTPRSEDRERVEMRSPDGQAADGERRGVDPRTDGGAPPAPEDVDHAPAPSAEGTTALAGVVTGPDGKPVPRFRVILLADREVPDVVMPIVRAFESADGAFRWDGLAPDRYEVFVEADGLAQDRRGPLDLSSEAAPLDLDVALARGRRLRGWVVDEATEAPIPGATVVVESETPSKLLPLDLDPMPDWLTHVATTASDGGFTLEELSAGPCRLRVDAPGFAPKWVLVDVAPVQAGEAGGGGAEAGEVADAPQTIVRLGAGGGVHGTVTDGSSQPVAGSVVLATFADDPALARLFSYEETRTDLRGAYAFEHLAPGFYMIIQWNDEASFHGGDSPTLRPAVVTAGESLEVDFRGELASGRIVGVLRDAAGEAMPHQKLTLIPEAASSAADTEDWLAGSSDSEGRFALPIEAGGRYFLYATFGMGERLALIHEFDVAEGALELVEDVRVPATRAVVEVVRVLDGSKVPRATLVALRRNPDGEECFAGRGLTDERGMAELSGLVPGRYRFVAEALDELELGQGVSASINLRADPGADPLVARVELPVGGALRIGVTQPDGAPLAGAEIFVSAAGGPKFAPFVEPVTGSDGRLVIPGLAPGRYSVRISRAGFAPQTLEVDVRPVAGGAINVTLSLQE